MKFFVPGTPVPKGSAKAFVHRRTGRAIVRQDNAERQKPWASAISYTAQQRGCRPAHGPVRIELWFRMPRPKNHYGTGRNAGVLKRGAKIYHTSTPDLDKLVRLVKDALTGVAWSDDSQVAEVAASKTYDECPGVVVEILELAEGF